MSDIDDYVKLVENARRGEKDCLDRLAVAARVRLEEYVYRLTLERDLTQDIVQESILEMFKVFDKLKRAERFWPWLYGIAFNKVRSHYGERWRHRTVTLAGASGEVAAGDAKDGLADVVTREFKQIVLKSMEEIEPRHRAVLTMRCYDQMAYSEIAKVMGCSQFGARAVFYRAKKALAKRLGEYGLGKSSLLIVLGVFGKITATSEAAAANVSVTAATLKVGLAASIGATVTSKTAVVSLVAAGLIGGGSLVSSICTNEAGAPAGETWGLVDTQEGASKGSAGLQEWWHFFPEGPGRPLMTRLMESDRGGGNLICRYLQNQHGNYYYDDNTVAIKNYRYYNPDLSVKRLSTDGREFSEFISGVEGRGGGMEYVADSRKGLLVILKRDAAESNRIWSVARHQTVLEEQYFQCDWPASAKIEDDRDAMHERGWTWFRVSGEINGEVVSGRGRMPFVYEASAAHYAWLDMRVGDKLRIVDTGADAGVYDQDGGLVARYEGGSFFEGLARPWMGLHTVDSVRRDAASKRVWFETKYGAGKGRAEVVLSCDNVKLVYEIDLERDVVGRITFLGKNNGGQDATGEVRFTYLQEIPATSGGFAAPRAMSSARGRWDRLGTFWVAKLADEKW